MGVSLTTVSICRTVTEIQRKVAQKGKRNPVSRHFHAREDKTAIAGWKRDLVRTLQTFNVRSADRVWRPLRASHSDGTIDE